MTASLREFDWPRFLKAPDGQLVAQLYEPGLRRAVKYERCCAYFSSSVLSAAAAGFGAFIERILLRRDHAEAGASSSRKRGAVGSPMSRRCCNAVWMDR